MYVPVVWDPDGNKLTHARSEKHGSDDPLGSSSSGDRCTTDTLYVLSTRRVRLLCTTPPKQALNVIIVQSGFQWKDTVARICYESGDCSVAQKN